MAIAIHTAPVSDRVGAAAGLGMEGCARRVVVAFAMASLIPEAADEMRVDAVGIEPQSDEITSAHPGSMAPLSQGDPGPGCAACGGKHLHPLERLLHAARAQRTRIGERTEECGGDVAVHHW